MPLLALTAFLAALLANSGWAQAGKVAIINSQEVLEKSIEGKKILARLQDRDKQNQTAVTRLEDEIRQLQTRLTTQRLTLSDEAALQLNSDLEKKKKERDRYAEDAVRDLQELQFRLYSKLQTDLMPLIEQLGKEKGYDLILDLGKSGAVFFNPAIDITPEVVKRYDASRATAPAPK